MARFFVLAALVAAAAAFQAPGMASKMGASKVVATPARVAPLSMSEPTDKAVTIGAASVGGLIGVYFFHELSTAVVLSVIFAYSSTLSNSFGSFTKSAGSSAAKVYGKTLELNEQYDVVPKAKSALDTVTTAASNLDANYGVTAKIDEQLKLSASVEKVTAKVDELKGSLTDKVDDLKSKASSK
eukprot:CAMPEP_0115838192 /NCGR_PEP_ID=MMETSP0287-20121206/5603_1 /TAXON_ID=412157 /ORGANISM="Chrysochromulina rotalis, Strain UIO044" /LENGTH=183 /DNA_ID=CAMNT_0003291713 /DNA_START=38 /DNA_END=589 /DNA_ORIENTATION=+